MSEKKRKVRVDYSKWETFDGSQKHKNIIIADTYVRGTPGNPKLLKKALLECSNELVRRDTEEIQYNVPELFIDEGEE